MIISYSEAIFSMVLTIPDSCYVAAYSAEAAAKAGKPASQSRTGLLRPAQHGEKKP